MPSSKVDSTETAKSRKPSSKVANDQTDPKMVEGNDAASVDSSEERILTIDRRSGLRGDRRANPDELDVGVMKNPRRKKQRRRHIDPTTCERDYSDPEIEFMRAMDDYKRKSGRMFPTCSEVLEVVRDLGYVRLTEDQRDALGLDDLEDQEDALADTELLDADDQEQDED
ncbi:hypothetical protein [Roseiconus nitratireducens]|uniref:hypothetical protein n=1 Tax=Roseiconus nitratireducens TaxID=2605748 RepID=UPI001F3DD731|nr:hypothetical protein [Roseiconus nitratireducens]